MTTKAPDFERVEQAFSNGDSQSGLAFLRQMAENHSDNAEVLYRTAVVEEQIGDKEQAKDYYCRLLVVASNNPLSYLYAGALFDRTGEPEVAALLYSLGQDLDARLCHYHRLANINAQTAQRSKMAQACLASHRQQQHEQAVGELSPKIAKAVWVQETIVDIDFKHHQQQPHLFYIPDLSPRPLVDIANEDWGRDIERQVDIIQSELQVALDNGQQDLEPYLDENLRSHETFTGLAGSHNWSALHLFRNGKCNEPVARHFPETLKMLASVPTYGLDDRPFEVFFSLLAAGQEIPPHYGLSNHSLTVHLPIEVPDDCYLQVAGKMHQWQRGQLVAFDDTFLHAAYNNSEHLRVVLIFSIWQPELDANDKAAIQQSFKVKQQWLEGRQQQLETLIKQRDNHG